MTHSPARGGCRPSIAIAFVAFALAIGFGTGVVVAAETVENVEITPAEVGIDTDTEHHELSFEATGLQVNETDPATITIDLSEGYGDDAPGSIEQVISADITTPSGDLDVEMADRDDGVIVYDLERDTDEAIDVEGVVELELDHPDLSGSFSIDLTATGTDGVSADDDTEIEVTAADVRYLVDGEEKDPIFRGQTITVTGLEPGEEYDLRIVEETDDGVIDDSDLEEQNFVETDADGDATFETDDLDVDEEYFLDGPNVERTEEDAFELIAQDLEVDFEDGEVVAGGPESDTELEFDSNRGDYSTNVTADGLDAEALFRILTAGESAEGVPRDAIPGELESATTTGDLNVALYDDSVDDADETVVLVDIDDREADVVFDQIQPATYEFEFVVTDTNVSDTDTIDVEELVVDVTFDQDVYRTPAGDFVTIDVELEGLETAYVIVGGDRATASLATDGYVDILRVNDSTEFTVNTRLLGTDVDRDRVYMHDDDDDVVTSYAYDIGSETEPQEEFAELQFLDEDGAEIADSLEAFRERIEMTELSRPLQPGRYALVAGSDGTIVLRDEGVPTFQNPLERSNIVLTPPEPEALTTYVAPPAPANIVQDTDDIEEILEVATERETLARTDRLVVEIEATGLWGTVLEGTSTDEDAVFDDGFGPVPLTELLDSEEGIHLEIEQTDVAANRDPKTVPIEEAVDGDIYVVPDVETDDDAPVIDRFFLSIDTRGDGVFGDGTGPFSAEPADGDRFEIRLRYESPEGEQYRFEDATEKPNPFDAATALPEDELERYPYFGVGQTTKEQTASFVVEDRRIEYNRTSEDDELIVPAVENATIAGVTNVAPHATAFIQLVDHDGEAVAVMETEIEEDGTVSVDRDLSGLEPGDVLDVEFYVDERLVDVRPTVIVDDPDEPIAFEITEYPEEIPIDRDTDRAELPVTITNTGEVLGRHEIALEYENETIDRRAPMLDPNESVAFEFDTGPRLHEPGAYEFHVTTPADEATIELFVGNDTGEFQIEAIDPENVTVERNESFDLTVAVENVGEDLDHGAVELEIDDEHIGQAELSIRSGDTASVQFADLPESSLDPGTYDLVVSTEDDDATGSLTIEPSEEEGDADENESDPDELTDGDSEDGPDLDSGPPENVSVDDEETTSSEGNPSDTTGGGSPDNDPAGNFGLPFGIGLRHVLGSAAIVATVVLWEYLNSSSVR